MKKLLKSLAKKSFSLFMAVMMLLTCWVWVAPEHEHASAYKPSDHNNADLIASFEKWFNGSTSINTTYGNYFAGDTGKDNSLYSGYYNKLIYSAVASGSAGSANASSYSGMQSLNIYYPETVLMYDGSTSYPKFAASIVKDASDGYKMIFYGAAIDDFYVPNYWRTKSDAAENGFDTASFYDWYNGGNNNAGSGSTTTSDSNNHEGKSSGYFGMANTVEYRGSMKNDVFKTSINPVFRIHVKITADCDKNTAAGDVVIPITGTAPIHILNVAPWNQAVYEAIGIYNEYFYQTGYESKDYYTDDSYNAYSTAVKDLLDCNPNSYKWSDGAAKAAGDYADEAASAVKNWNEWKSKTESKLERRTQKVIFNKFDGGSEEISNTNTEYGDTVVLTSIAPANKTPTSDNIAQHQTYVWKYNGAVIDSEPITIGKSDIVVNEETGGLADHSYGSYTSDNETHERTCSICNYLDKAGHTPVDGSAVVISPATCTSKGTTRYTCSVCNKPYELQDIDMLAHTYDESKTYINEVTASTCTVEGTGVEMKFCSTCQKWYEIRSVSLPLAAHSYETITVSPTCTDQGYTYERCTKCGHETQPHDFTETIPHTIVTIPGKAATCEESGLTEGKYCSVCKEVIEAQFEIKPLGHKEGTPVEENRVEATCEADGSYDIVVYCTVCKDKNGKPTELSREKKTITKLGHDYEAVVTDPTCTDEGYTTYTCKNDPKHTYIDDYVDPLGHVEGEPVKIEEKAATCKDDGYYVEAVYCTRCGEELSRNKVVVWATGAHVYVYTSNGDGTHTGRCGGGCGFVENENEPHYGGTATCIALAKCEKCGAEHGNFAEHNYTEQVAEDKYLASKATCTDRATYYYSCSVCGKSSKDDTNATFEAGTTLPHDFSNKNTDAKYLASAATCKEVATYYYSCSVCGAKGTETFEFGDVLPHTYDKEVPLPEYRISVATCKDKAKYYKSCVCGASSNSLDEDKIFEYGELLPHVFTKAVVHDDYLVSAATCTTYAKYYYSCANCGESCGAEGKDYTVTTFRDVNGGLAPHDFTAEIQKEAEGFVQTSATCMSGGVYYKSCTACGTPSETETFEGEALPHIMATVIIREDADDENVKAATCGTEGQYKYITKCVRYEDPTGKCDCAIKIEYKKTPATGKHTFPTNWDKITEATCGKDGERIKYCTICNTATVTEKIPATGIHDYEGVEWKVTTPATCNKMGTKVRECKNCKHPEIESIPVVGHTWTEHNAYDRLKTPATCVASAVYYKHCATCGMTMGGETYEFGDIDLVNGHNFGGEIRTNDDGTFEYKCVNEGCNEYGAKSACTFDKVVEEVASTCQNYGYTKYQCTSCPTAHYKVVNSEELDPTNHELDSTIFLNAKDAYCDEAGYTGDYYFACCYDETKTKEENDAAALDTSDEKKGQKILVSQATGHRAENIVTVEAKAPTCTEVGYEAYQKCSHCGTVIDEYVEIPATDHLYGNWTQVVTTDDEGKAVYNHVRTCSVCADGTEGKIQTEACSGGEATCIADALCATCGQKYADKDSNNHKNIQTKPEVDSTCQAAGYEAYKYCADCSTPDNEVVIGEKKIIPVKDHVFDNNWTQTNVVDDEGNVEYKHSRTCLTCNIETETEACSGGVAYCNEQATCQVCKTKYGATNPDNHKTASWHYGSNKAAATCTAAGNTGDRLYDCCNAVKQAGTVIPQLEHEYTIEVSKTPATCIEEGSVTYKCKDCTAEKTEIIPVNSRNHASDEITTVGYRAATCTTAGFTGNKYHSCCYDSTKTESENRKALAITGKEIPTNGTHSYSAPVPEYMIATRTESTDENGKVTVTFTYKTTEPTYAEKVAARHADGKWYHVQQCAECGDVLTKACTTYSHTINCVDHDVCDVCKGLCSLIDETNHKYELTLKAGTPATCMVDGVKDYYECAGCKKTYLDKAGKTFVDPDTDAGKAALKIDKSTAQHVINWSKADETVAGTCGTSGYQVFKCTVEGCTYKAKKDTGVVSTNHSWPVDNTGNYVYTVTDTPTCGANGYQAIKCTVCQAIKLNSYVSIPATGNHTYGTPVEVPGSSCTQPGTITYTCTGCGHKKVETSTSGVSAHVWTVEENDGWYVTGGNCLTGVSIERKCKNCDYSQQSTLSGEHNYIEYERVEPTAERDGYVIYECKNCKFRTDPEVLKYEGNDPVDPENPDVPEIPDDPEVNKHKFNYDEYRVIEEATCQSAEIREYVCLECGEKVRLPFGEMEDHVWLRQPAEKATCDRDGHSEYYRCVRCLAEDPTEPKVIYPATGHHDDDGNGKCDSCNAAFYNDGASTCSCMCHKTGFMGFIYKIVSFFWKLFKMNPSCACGNAHY